MSSFTETELLRAVAQMVMVADVLEVDTGAARARVSFGPGTKSAWLPWMTERASAISVWAPPSVGEQVVCLSPAGATERAIILGALYSSNNAAPSGGEGEHVLNLGNSSITTTTSGIVIETNGSVLEIDGSSIVLSSNGATITLDGSGISFAGAATAVDTATLTHNGTDVGDTHTHKGVTPGGARTLDPK